ncbi:MAG: AAA family ATPase, partial [Actinobacteria bacterium]|nr:AAA family ATPase [Actinomycetota bacterium]
AISNSDKTYVLVVDDYVPDSPMTALERVEVLSEVHPEAIVKVMPNIEHDDNSEYWAEYTKAFLGFAPDVVFTSEEYGETWAKALGCEHKLVDLFRKRYSISGTEVRRNPKQSRSWVHPATWAHIVPRVAILGAESTGTTTLANDLGRHYKTEVVPEFGRMRDEEKVLRDGTPYDWPSSDFFYVARVQQAMENQLARKADSVLICDTDALATYLWHERYLGYRDPKILKVAKKHKYDLYIITSPEGIEPEEDGLRFEMHKRKQMHEDFMELLTELDRPFIVVEGSETERAEQAAKAISNLA